ncbi:hypothetical protein R1sor_007040 [Riccia sorocarpa]|uniref:Phytocyanin domain-containing protein n=1 Tax=Riccia sorocarpa TaxID=122646 RepID=A0ABD3HSR9_9MARC
MARGGLSSSALVFLFLCCAGFLVSSSFAKTHIVGGGKWTYQTSPTFYDDWAANQTFEVNDDLLFVYAKASHNVWVVTVADLATCNAENSVEKYEDANATISLYRSGDFAFLCEYPGHCTQGMKMKLTVPEAPAGSPGSAPAPSPEEESAPAPQVAPTPEDLQSPPPPPDSTDTSPPEPSAATSLPSLSALVVGSLSAYLAALFIL